jgi:hypothetical protein
VSTAFVCLFVFVCLFFHRAVRGPFDSSSLT